MVFFSDILPFGSKLISRFFISYLLVFLINPVFSKQKINRSNLTKRAERHYSKANYNSALQLFKRSINEGDATGVPSFFIGLILEAKRKFHESIQYYMKSVELPLEKQFKKAALWKIMLYFQQTENYAQLLEYADALREIIGENKRLEEMIMKAELNASPTHMEARKRLNEANEIAATYLSNRKKKSFWEDHSASITEVALIYEGVAQMHEKYRNLAWKAANYYEHLNLYDDAIRTYRWIANDSNAPKANYKIGVILRKQKKYGDSEEYLNNVINSEDTEKKLKYYAYLNMAQVHYGIRSFVRAEEDAKKILSSKFTKERKKYQKKILYLIKCNSSLQLSEILQRATEKKMIKTWKKSFRRCYSYIKRKNFFKRSDDYSLITLTNLIRGKWFHLASAINQKFQKKNIELALEYYAQSFLYLLPHEKTSKIDNTVIDSKNTEGIVIYAQTINTEPPKESRKDWCLSELEDVVTFIFKSKKYKVLYNFISRYPNKLNMHQNYATWVADSYFYLGNYNQAYQAYQEIHNRSIAIEKNLLVSFAHLQKWGKFQTELKNYIYSFINLKEEIISFLKVEKKLLHFREKESFSTFLVEVQKIGGNATMEKGSEKVEDIQENQEETQNIQAE